MLPGSATAGAPDPTRVRDAWEERVLEGDLDPEDLAAFHGAPRGDLAPRGGAYLALEGFAGDHVGVSKELGAMVILNLPLERFASAPLPVPRAALAEEVAPRAPSPPRALAPESAEKSPIVVTTDLARSCVKAAWRALGVADDARLDSLVSRARSSAVLPELRLRLARTIDESGRLTVTDADPDRYTAAGGATNWFEARVSFRLDRLLFADDEIPLERLRIDRSELRSRTAAKALQALFEWQRAYALALENGTTSDEHLAAVMRELEAAAMLDVMTDGWFSRFRATTPLGTTSATPTTTNGPTQRDEVRTPGSIPRGRRATPQGVHGAPRIVDPARRGPSGPGSAPQ